MCVSLFFIALSLFVITCCCCQVLQSQPQSQMGTDLLLNHNRLMSQYNAQMAQQQLSSAQHAKQAERAQRAEAQRHAAGELVHGGI